MRFYLRVYGLKILCNTRISKWLAFLSDLDMVGIVAFANTSHSSYLIVRRESFDFGYKVSSFLKGSYPLPALQSTVLLCQ